MLTLVAMADTHGFEDDLDVPDGDVLIHAGDLTRLGELDEIRRVNRFLASLPHRHKLVVAGNHDWSFQTKPDLARKALTAATYLEDSAVVIEGVKFYGSPWQPWFLDWAFNLQRGAPLVEKWALIPEDVDVLITHGPPAGIGDKASDGRVGCDDLLRRVEAIKPKLHIFGHIHEDRGIWKRGSTVFVNATTSECTLPVTVLRYPPSS
jgi:Icc-related predicted phosphoesterase